MQRNVLGHLTPRQLVGCMQVSRFYNKFIQETPSLNQSVQHGKYLLLAKQTAEQIQENHLKSIAYCAIAAALLPQ